MTQIITRYKGNRVNTLRDIAKAGQRDSTARECMIDRIADLKRSGTFSYYFKEGGWSSEGVVRIGGVNYWCLAEYAPTTLYAREALEANRAGKYLTLTKDIQIYGMPITDFIPKLAEVDAKKPVHRRRVLIPKNQSPFYTMKTTNFANQDVPVFLARSEKLAEKYGNALDDFGIPETHVHQNKFSANENIAEGLWINQLGKGGTSDFHGSLMMFDYDTCFSFGVSDIAKEHNIKILTERLRNFKRDVREYTLPFVSPNHKDIFLDGLEKIFQSNKGKLR